ncbi:RhuM family protein [Lachnospira pectinoschiza]|uniref:Fic/DOC family protein n=1 Tax=Lachnospira pectinoschiza TaxID=28052 RepID=A0A1G9SZ15_9FIRM|nr:RhuM family protein [Lachnospira pectinoschiza]SDM40636.1 Fic/DOC family protein [Lachnospira pectinoschiza]
MKKSEIVLFETEDKEVKLQVQLRQDSVWLNREQIAELFGRDIKTIGKHISNALKEEVDESTVAKFATVQKEGGRSVKRNIEHYNLDMILSIGYRVKSKRGIEFRRWSNRVLKQYIIDGYAINEKRLKALQKTVDIQTRMLADALNVEEKDILKAVNLYTDALTLLDQYDHQAIVKPDGKAPVYRITYDDCMTMVSHMRDSFDTDVFGVEKEVGKVNGIISAIYQSVIGEDAYPTIEEKAANLLYFMIKDHPFADGCKRIAASLFIEFLERNQALFKDGSKRIGDGELVAITLMIAESNPDEKDIMVKLVMNLLDMK